MKLKRKEFITILLMLQTFSLIAQDNNKWQIPFYFSDYPKKYIYLPDTLNLFDTIRVEYDHTTYFKFVFRSFQGDAYCEVYKGNKIYEKGNFINSLDTLKKYTSLRGSRLGERSVGKIVFSYYEPLRNGEWVMFRDGRVIKHQYIKGIEVQYSQ